MAKSSELNYIMLFTGVLFYLLFIGRFYEGFEGGIIVTLSVLCLFLFALNDK